MTIEIINAMQLYYDEGHSSYQVAKKFGMSPTNVRYHIKTRPITKLTLLEKRAKSVINVTKRRKKLKLLAVAYKGGKCERCGYNKYVGALEFHHINPSQKDFGFSSKGITLSWEKMKKELDKCMLLCSNCHSEVHEEIRQQNK